MRSAHGEGALRLTELEDLNIPGGEEEVSVFVTRGES